MERKEIEFLYKTELEDCYKELQDLKKKDNNYIYFGIFNTHEITSEMTLDECFIKVLGKTKEEFDKGQKAFLKRLEKDEEEFQKKSPELAENLKKRSKDFVPKDKLEMWNDLIDINCQDGYSYSIMSDLIRLIEVYNKNHSLEEVKEEFDRQGHSGFTASNVFLVLESYFDYGELLSEFIREKLSEKTKKKLLLKWKEKLNEREYREEITNEEIMELEELGIVAMFGASDDLLEFRGAYCGEFDCYVVYDFKKLCYVKEANTFVSPDYYEKHEYELIQINLSKKPQIKIEGPAWKYTMPEELLCEKAQIIETDSYTGAKDIYGELVLFFWEDFINLGKVD